MKKLVIYNHGKDSSPWSDKPLIFAEVAKRHGYIVENPDYRQQLNPDERVKQLLAMNLSDYDEIVLMGSSMGLMLLPLQLKPLNPAGFFCWLPPFICPAICELNSIHWLIIRW
jgi:hypothetical protein